MKHWKTYQISLFVLLCILLNYAGKSLAARYDLPLWLDAFGTVLSAYMGGIGVGCIVGLMNNLMELMTRQSPAVYALVSVALAVITGYAAKKRAMDSIFGAMTAGAMSAIAAILIAAPLDILFYDYSTGNLWGDGVIGFWSERGVPRAVGVFAGEFYINFADKLLTMLALYLVLRLARAWTRRKHKPEQAAASALVAALALSLCLAAAPMPARAEEADLAEDYNDYVQTVYSSKNGLPCGEANDIAQTNDGILWIGTYAGLYRYNGREFRWMDDFDSVRNVNCLYVDAEGRLWIGTNDKGLSICINETITNVVDQDKGLPSNSVRSIIQSSDGYYYIGTTGSMQILSLDGGLKRLTTLPEVYYSDYSAADDRGHVVTVTNNGRLFLLEKGRILCSRQLTRGGEIFKSCCFDEKGRLLAGTSASNIYIFDISKGGFDELSSSYYEGLNSINDLRYLEDGELFICADNGVGYEDAQGQYHRVNTNDFNNSIDNMQVDYQGNLWFTSSRLGLLRMAPSAFRDVYSTVGMDSRVVNTVTRWRNCYYIGTDKGLDVVDETCKHEVNNALTRQLEGVRIRCMTTDSDNNLWICTYGSGLMEVDPEGSVHLYNGENGSFGNRARVVKELNNGVIMAAGDTGISFIRNHKVEHTIGYTDGLINSMILTITELDDGRILAGTDGDGIAVLEDYQVSRMLTRADGLESEVILRSVKDPKGEGVFLVTSNGLAFLDKNDEIRSLDNFPYFNNYDIWAKDENTLMVLSSAGIYVVDRDDLLSGEDPLGYDLLDARRGLNSALTANSWNYCDDQGNMFLSCDTGMFVIDMARYSGGVSSYRMMISSVRLDNAVQQVERGSAVTIGREVSKVEFLPEVINYTIQDPNVGYYLEGFDNDWSMTSQSALGSIVYTNLPSGEYTFHMAVFDSEQEEILEERTYQIVKERAIYDNPWFVLYIALVPMLAVIWITWFAGRRRLERQERELALARQQVQMGNETVIAIAKAVDAKDERTSQHSFRVSQYSVLIAREMGFDEKECENLRRAAQLHDIGKIGIPDSILNKPARLTDEEYAVMKTHTTRGAEILKDFTLIDHVVEGAQFHHERFDGRGYPKGLKGDEIPIYGRIIGVADAFDAMTANRVYRKQMDFDYVLSEMRKGRGTQFDPHIVDIMLKLIDDGKINLNELYGNADAAKQGG